MLTWPHVCVHEFKHRLPQVTALHVVLLSFHRMHKRHLRSILPKDMQVPERRHLWHHAWHLWLPSWLHWGWLQWTYVPPTYEGMNMLIIPRSTTGSKGAKAEFLRITLRKVNVAMILINNSKHKPTSILDWGLLTSNFYWELESVKGDKEIHLVITPLPNSTELKSKLEHLFEKIRAGLGFLCSQYQAHWLKFHDCIYLQQSSSSKVSIFSSHHKVNSVLKPKDLNYLSKNYWHKVQGTRYILKNM